MTVAELIAKLQTFDAKASVYLQLIGEDYSEPLLHAFEGSGRVDVDEYRYRKVDGVFLTDSIADHSNDAQWGEDE